MECPPTAPAGYTTISGCVNRLEKEMFTGPPQPALLDQVKEHPEIGRDAAIGFGPWRDQAARSIHDAAIAGHLTVYCAIVDESHGVDKGSIEIVPQEAVKLIIPVHSGLPDRPVHLYRLQPGSSISSRLLTKLKRGILLLSEVEFDAWCEAELRKTNCLSQSERDAAKVGGPSTGELASGRERRLINKNEKGRRFEEYLPREGFADVAISAEDFGAILSDALPGVEWPDNVIDAAFEEAAGYLSRAVGHWGWSTFNTRRRDLRERLELLRKSLKTAAYILASVGDLREKIDIDLLGFIANAAIEKDPDLTYAAMNRKYAAVHYGLEKLITYVETAGAIMDQTSADGPARMTWYDPIVAGSVAAARRLDIPLTIGGDRSDDPGDTPFIRLIMGLEFSFHRRCNPKPVPPARNALSAAQLGVRLAHRRFTTFAELGSLTPRGHMPKRGVDIGALKRDAQARARHRNGALRR